jgi:tetratricopeptide (TPR) repeat protein
MEEEGFIKSNDSYIRGENYFTQGYYQSALMEFKNVPSSHPEFQKAKEYLEKTNQRLSRVVYYETNAIQYEKQGELLKARHSLEHALKIYPKNKEIQKLHKNLNKEIHILAELSFKKGNSFYQEGDFDNAITHFKKAYQMGSSGHALADRLAIAYNSRALNLYRKGNLTEAIANLKQSLDINPKQENIRVQLNEMEHRLGLLKKLSP